MTETTEYHAHHTGHNGVIEADRCRHTGALMPARAECYMCRQCLDDDESRGPTEISAVWIDAYGDSDGVVERICAECYDASGAVPTSGPGWVLADHYSDSL